MQREIKDYPLSLLPWLAGKASLPVRVSCARGKRLCDVVRGNLTRLGFFSWFGRDGASEGGCVCVGNMGRCSVCIVGTFLFMDVG